MSRRFYLWRVSPKMRRKIRWAFLHAALTVFLLDFVASLYPPFDLWWRDQQHLFVPLATVLAALSESFLFGEEESA